MFTLKPRDAERLYLLAIRAREQQHETWEALRLVQQALSGMKNPQRRQALQAQQTRLNLELARVQENQARAPKIHAELEQDRVVRARWIAGTPFVPQAIAEGEDSE